MLAESAWTRTRRWWTPPLIRVALLGLVLVAGRAGADAISAQPAPARIYSPSFVLDGALESPRTVTLADLQAMPSQEIAVEYLSGMNQVRATYRGVRLYDLLMAAGPRFDASVRNDMLRWYVLVSATDGYQAVIAWGEIDPGFENKPVLVAYEEDGAPLGPADGMARLVVPGDARGGRYVSNINAITLVRGQAPPPSS